jgi:hypothetical protein
MTMRGRMRMMTITIKHASDSDCDEDERLWCPQKRGPKWKPCNGKKPSTTSPGRCNSKAGGRSGRWSCDRFRKAQN